MTSAVLPVYKRSDLYLEKGEGVWLYAPDGTKYLDFAAGIAVNALGHCHPAMVSAIKEQAETLWHISNIYQIPMLEEYATSLVDATCLDYAFFCSSGAEANECGIKMLRRYQHAKNGGKKYRIITFTGCFHGRTMATISASGEPRVLEGFEPALDGFDKAEFNNIESFKAAITDETAGVIIEPIQGDGGINPADKAFMQEVSKICKEKDLVVMLDEIQCGMGRTGKLFAYEWFGIEPDILTTAKGLGGGFPVGACLSKTHIADAMSKGSHGSTYGSNPLAMKVGYTVLQEINKPEVLKQVEDVSAYLIDGLKKLQSQFSDVIEEIRGFGLMIGIKPFPTNEEFVTKLREHQLLTVPAAGNIVRLLPPLIITQADADEALNRISAVCESYSS